MHMIAMLVAHVVLAASGGPDDGAIITVLVALIGVFAALAGTVILPRMLGQLVPSSKVDEVRAQLTGERDKALAEAATWKEAFGGMKEAHNGVLEINRSLTSQAVITSTVLNALKNAATGTTGGG